MRRCWSTTGDSFGSSRPTCAWMTGASVELHALSADPYADGGPRPDSPPLGLVVRVPGARAANRLLGDGGDGRIRLPDRCRKSRAGCRTGRNESARAVLGTDPSHAEPRGMQIPLAQRIDMGAARRTFEMQQFASTSDHGARDVAAQPKTGCPSDDGGVEWSRMSTARRARCIGADDGELVGYLVRPPTERHPDHSSGPRWRADDLGGRGRSAAPARAGEPGRDLDVRSDDGEGTRPDRDGLSGRLLMGGAVRLRESRVAPVQGRHPDRSPHPRTAGVLTGRTSSADDVVKCSTRRRVGEVRPDRRPPWREALGARGSSPRGRHGIPFDQQHEPVW